MISTELRGIPRIISELCVRWAYPGISDIQHPRSECLELTPTISVINRIFICPSSYDYIEVLSSSQAQHVEPCSKWCHTYFQQGPVTQFLPPLDWLWYRTTTSHYISLDRLHTLHYTRIWYKFQIKFQLKVDYYINCNSKKNAFSFRTLAEITLFATRAWECQILLELLLTTGDYNLRLFWDQLLTEGWH